MLYMRARAFRLLFEASTAAKAAPHTIPYGLASMQRLTSVVGNKIDHFFSTLRDSAGYAFDQAAQRCDAIPNPHQTMLRFCSVSFLAAACCSTVLPFSLFMVCAAAAAEILKANGAADWPA